MEDVKASNAVELANNATADTISKEIGDLDKCNRLLENVSSILMDV